MKNFLIAVVLSTVFNCRLKFFFVPTLGVSNIFVHLCNKLECLPIVDNSALALQMRANVGAYVLMWSILKCLTKTSYFHARLTILHK